MQRFTSLNVCGSVTYISWSSDSVLYLEEYLMEECCTLDIDLVWQENWSEAIYVGQWPIFRGPVILYCILETIWWTNVIIGILNPCDAEIYLIKCMWVSGPRFMVQLFCLISWRLFDGWMFYWRYWFSATLTLTYKYIFRSLTYMWRYSDLEYYLKNNPHSLDIGSVWYGPLTCISWCSDLIIFQFLPIVMIVDMKMFAQSARRALQGHWWGFISRNYLVWPTFLINVFIALKGSHFWFLFDFTAAGVVQCGGRKTSPRTSTIVQFIFYFGLLRTAIIFWEIRNKWLV